MREHQPRGPFGMRLVVARRIGHGAAEAANLATVEDVGDPQAGRSKSPSASARTIRASLVSPRLIFESHPGGIGWLYRSAQRCATREPAHSCRARPRSAASCPTPTARAATVSASIFSSHWRQSGHHDPLCSCAPLSQSASVTSLILSLVQNWYLPDAGGLTTPAIWPDPDNTYFTGPPKNCEPYSTESAGAM